MKKQHSVLVIGAALLLGGTIVALRQVEHAKKRMERAYNHWHPITVNCKSTSITMDRLELEPLRDLGDAIEVRIRPATGNRGTEIAARLRTDPNGMAANPSPGMLGKLRAALRDTQLLLETGEILHPDTPPSTRRTILNWPLQFATKHAKEGGRL